MRRAIRLRAGTIGGTGWHRERGHFLYVLFMYKEYGYHVNSARLWQEGVLQRQSKRSPRAASLNEEGAMAIPGRLTYKRHQTIRNPGIIREILHTRYRYGHSVDYGMEQE
jgi:hypothetical protein